MQVREVMTRGAECIQPEATLQDAARRMRELNVGALPICDNDRLAGMVTDRDITIRATAEGRDPRTATVREVMTAETIYCFEDQDVREVAQLMEQKQIRRLPILSRDKRMVGIVSLGDLAVKAHDQKLSGSTLEHVSEPSRPARAAA
jgi:CBS domain-containing protein